MHPYFLVERDVVPLLGFRACVPGYSEPTSPPDQHRKQRRGHHVISGHGRVQRRSWRAPGLPTL